MKWPTLTWILFGCSLALVLAAMGWVSGKVLALETEGREVRRNAEREERIRLALWRMESIASPRVADEQARPYFDFKAFYSPDRAYTRLFAEVKPGDVLIPSPLLFERSPHIRLHFQIRPDSHVESPQVPEGNMRDLAEGMYGLTESIRVAEERLEALRRILASQSIEGRLPPPSSGVPSVDVRSPGQTLIVPQQTSQAQSTLNQVEWQKRWNAYQNDNRIKQQQKLSKVSQRPALPVVEGAVRPIWLGEELVLARRVRVGKQEFVQGCWFDLAELERVLLDEVTDLAPGSRLEPVREGASDPSRQLASLPLRMVPGQLPTRQGAERSPLILSLGVAWSAVLLAALAFGFLLHGILSLSERRAAFVSAVTHELRTPLTTLRMQTEMLAEGMIEDEATRQDVYRTLEKEASRLANLVENVLCYARLERVGTQGQRPREQVSVESLLTRIQPRLEERARQSGMELVTSLEGTTETAILEVDPVAIEQVLFNLVDNAAKYARHAEDLRVHLETERKGNRIFFAVRDHGPGIRSVEARRLFRPFRKSAAEAAETEPGVGLGLSLARGMARSQGGELRLEEGEREGATFVLSLPLRG